MIITYLLIFACGCGYKADPFYKAEINSTNLVCVDFLESASIHSLQRIQGMFHLFALCSPKNSSTILKFAFGIESDSMLSKNNGKSCVVSNNLSACRPLIWSHT